MEMVNSEIDQLFELELVLDQDNESDWIGK